MAINWDNYPPNNSYAPLAIELVREIGRHTLATGAGTEGHPLRVRLKKDHVILNSLVTDRLISNFSDRYFPCFQSLFFLDPSARNVCEDGTRLFFKGLTYLHEHEGPGEYSPDQITHAVNLTTSRAISRELVRLGIQFGVEFGSFISVWRNGVQYPIDSVNVDNRILSFDGLENAWSDEYARRHPPPRIDTKLTAESGTDTSKQALPDEAAEFSFISNVRLRQIIERDYAELRRIRNGVKSRIVLAAGIIEGLLLDALIVEQTKSENQSLFASGNLNDWRLEKLISVAFELKLISEGVRGYSNVVRDFRNLVHPVKEMNGNYKVEDGEAQLAEATLEVVIRDLRGSKAPKVQA